MEDVFNEVEKEKFELVVTGTDKQMLTRPNYFPKCYLAYPKKSDILAFT